MHLGEGRAAQHASTGANSVLIGESNRGKAVFDEVLCKHGSQLFLKQSAAEKPALITFSSLILLFFSPPPFFFLPLGNKTRGTVVKCQK